MWINLVPRFPKARVVSEKRLVRSNPNNMMADIFFYYVLSWKPFFSIWIFYHRSQHSYTSLKICSIQCRLLCVIKQTLCLVFNLFSLNLLRAFLITLDYKPIIFYQFISLFFFFMVFSLSVDCSLLLGNLLSCLINAQKVCKDGCWVIYFLFHLHW